MSVTLEMLFCNLFSAFLISLLCYSVASAKTQSTGTLWEHCDGFQHLPKGKGIPNVKVLSQRNEILRRLERVFCCCSVCETMEDFKEGYLMVWTNYMSPCSSIVGLYFKGTCDVISVTIAMHKVYKSVL